MYIRGFQPSLDGDLAPLSCSALQALVQLREKLKTEMFKDKNDLNKFEPRPLQVAEKVYFPFQGRNYWLVTEIHYKTESIKVLKIITKEKLKEIYPAINELLIK